jgi:hypothetical protein
MAGDQPARATARRDELGGDGDDHQHRRNGKRKLWRERHGEESGG